jgi:tRNA-specific 2-thiouridylase
MKALALLSGGLDSTLAAKVVKDLGLEVIGVNFVFPFCKKEGWEKGSSAVHRTAQQVGIPLRVVDVSEDFLKMLQQPRHGYGSQMNPCIDCKILLLQKAKAMMEREGASFLITGEVLGQRPMSQRLDALYVIERDAGVRGILLRPLSAQNLNPTIPEEKGWVDRSKLLAISGRGRRPQMELAKNFGIEDYATPAGGCLLTDPAYAHRLKDLFEHQEVTFSDLDLLVAGRYFRLTSGAKLIVGKCLKDNEKLEKLAAGGDILLSPEEEKPGPTALARGDFSDQALLETAARITARYCDQKEGPVVIIVKRAGRCETLFVEPLDDAQGRKYLV